MSLTELPVSPLLKKVERPRDLNAFQAGAMLYGDWGTSKAYVLGIAFALSGHASWFFLGLMSCLTALVGVCYTIVCRSYPDGGGVYSSVRKRSSFLAVIGALLLVADYVVTASLSALEAFHYFNVSHPVVWAVGAIVLIGIINSIGPAKGGNIAIVIGVLASLSAVVLFLFTLPDLTKIELIWPTGKLSENWRVFVGIVLALSGVESVANMTGIMKHPVERTSRRAIWPVLIEVSLLTFLLGLAMNAIPGLTNHTEDMLRALGTHFVAPWYGGLISILFGLLLLSATNTSVVALVNIQFLMSRDRELPAAFSRLNRFGMPALGLLVAVVVPVAVLLIEGDVVHLASLYAIGVVGAITLNLASCGTNWDLSLKRWERLLLLIAAGILLVIEFTIAVEKHNALLFVTIVLGAGLTLRLVAKKLILPTIPMYVPEVNVLTVAEAKEIAPLYKSTLMVALRSFNERLIEEALLRLRSLGETSVYLLSIEESPHPPDLPEEVEPSIDSVNVLTQASKKMEEMGITGVPVWQFGKDPGTLIARAADELGVGTVLIGATQRSWLLNFLRGDVFRSLARHLPRECRLVISA